MVELKPCPFCGGYARMESGGPGCHYVRCDDCGACSDDGSLGRASGLWNTRTEHIEALSRTGAVKVKALLLDFEDFINQPPQYEDQRMVRDYRHELYRKWGPLCMAVLSALESAAPEHPANLADDDVDAAYQAALDNLPAEFRGEVGRGELDLMVRAIVKAHDSKWERRARAMAHHHHSALQASIDTSKPAAPEGQQEPVAAWQRRVLYPENGAKPQWKQCSATEATDQFARSPHHEYRPLFTRPSEQAVTEAMVEAASREYMRIFDKHLLSKHARLILTAAQEAGG